MSSRSPGRPGLPLEPSRRILRRICGEKSCSRGRAFDGTEKTLSMVFSKADFWKKHSAVPLNQRQRDVLNRLLDGFEGKLTSSKWATIEKCSPDTALRDIADLVERGILRKNEGGGRSTSYSLAEGSTK